MVDRGSRTLGLVGLACVWVLGCEPGRELSVGLQTDYVAGIEFDEVGIDLDGAEALRREARAGQSFARPTALLQRTDVLPGRRRVELTLRLGGEVVARRAVEIPFRERYLATVVITRSCREVRCPGARDEAGATECAGGRCVRPDCGTEGAPACPMPQCDSTTPCAPSSTACAESRCAGGVCLELARDGACAERELCVPGAGCVLGPDEPSDGGVPRDAVVAMCTVDGDCSAGPCEEARCVDGTCMPRSLCAVGEACCAGDVCAVDCASATCAGQPAGTLCRASEDACDAEERCDGTSPSCPADDVLASGVVCRPAVDGCDEAETCNGSVAACPSDAFASVGTTCAGGVCNGLGACGPCTEGATCATGNPCEAGALRCASGMPRCEAAGPSDASTVCRDSSGPCDLAETCGGATSCPADAFATGVVCQPSRGPCDLPESCDGASAACPSDVLLSGSVCRAASGVCELSASCDGVSPACPPSPLRSSGVCRVSSGSCDPAESCDGSSGDCPADVRSPGGTVCRAATGECDIVDACDGVSASCPPDALVPAGMMCSVGSCDGAGLCTMCPPISSRSIALAGRAFGVAIVDCRRALVTQLDAGQVSLVDLSTGMIERSTPAAGNPLNVGVTPDGRRAFVSSLAGTVTAMDVASGIAMMWTPGISNMRWALPNPSRPGEVWVTGSSIQALSDPTGASLRTTGVAVGEPNGIAFDVARDALLISDPLTGDVFSFDASSGALRAGPVRACTAAQGLAVASGASILYVACEGGGIARLALPSLTSMPSYTAPAPFDVALSPDEQRLVAAGGGDVRVLRASDGSLLGAFSVAQPRRARFTSDGRAVVVASESGTLEVIAVP